MACAQMQDHVVKRGDTLYGLGRKYNMTVAEIQRINELNDTNLSIGQVLKVKALPEQQAAAEQSARPSPEAALPRIPRSSLSPDFFYQIQRGDNLYRISRAHDISLNDLIKWNDFPDANVSIYPGQRLIIKDPAEASEIQPEAAARSQPEDSPAQEEETVVIEKVYIVQPKDTLFRIARENNTSVDELKRLNSLSSNNLTVGQKLYLAGSPRPADQAALDRLTEEDLLKKDKIRSDLALPVEGRVISEYGLRNGKPHKGIDIAAKNGTPIYAVLDGTVVYSGVQGAYGNVIVLEHPDFVMTVYAHNEKNLVNVGDKVEKGQHIAMAGSTGNASGSHLHFEYRIKGKAINPRKVLPLE
ncbi:MAG: LysM peptidoglycan-binding domain-containing protein [Candidatus Cloacimonadaceae bacterium]|nr:LysM peptidoglycan-binding domain-containing protein [Candidatus Cloacimonadota bacterium]MDY0127816.1 LysM peptidoglycan-binding domain-containing protein [Candidatus Cloacimonadaceae bacterium]